MIIGCSVGYESLATWNVVLDYFSTLLCLKQDVQLKFLKSLKIPSWEVELTTVYQIL